MNKLLEMTKMSIRSLSKWAKSIKFFKELEEDDQLSLIRARK